MRNIDTARQPKVTASDSENIKIRGAREQDRDVQVRNMAGVKQIEKRNSAQNTDVSGAANKGISARRRARGDRGLIGWG